MARQQSNIGLPRNSVDHIQLTSLIIPENNFYLQMTVPVLPDHLTYNSTAKLFLNKIPKQEQTITHKSITPATPLLQEMHSHSFNSTEKITIPHLRDFLVKFFKNESLYPILELNKAELGLLSSVLTRKYSKPISLKFFNQ